jgi:hypothetical protein
MAPFLAPEVPVRDPNEDGSRFWICDLDDSVPEHLAAAGTFGDRTVGVVDEVEGGIVLWDDMYPGWTESRVQYTRHARDNWTDEVIVTITESDGSTTQLRLEVTQLTGGPGRGQPLAVDQAALHAELKRIAQLG